MHNYLVRVLVVLLHARFSVVGPIPFPLAAIFFLGPPLVSAWLARAARAARLIEKVVQ